MYCSGLAEWWEIHPQNFHFTSNVIFHFPSTSISSPFFLTGKWKKNWKSLRSKFTPSSWTWNSLLCILCVGNLYFASSYSLEWTNNNDKLRLIDDGIVRSSLEPWKTFQSSSHVLLSFKFCKMLRSSILWTLRMLWTKWKLYSIFLSFAHPWKIIKKIKSNMITSFQRWWIATWQWTSNIPWKIISTFHYD